MLQANPTNDRCPGCGRCNHCGHTPYRPYPYVGPYYPYPYPYVYPYNQPVWISCQPASSSYVVSSINT